MRLRLTVLVPMSLCVIALTARLLWAQSCTGTPPTPSNETNDCIASHYCQCVHAASLIPGGTCDHNLGMCVDAPGCSENYAWGTMHDGYCRPSPLKSDGCTANSHKVTIYQICWQCVRKNIGCPPNKGYCVWDNSWQASTGFEVDDCN